MSFIGVAVSAVGIGLGAASAAGAFSPSQPNLTADSQQMANTQAALLPEILGLQKEAELGGTQLLPGYTQETASDNQRQAIQDQIDKLQNQQQKSSAKDSQSYVNEITRLQNQLKNIPQGGGTIYKDGNGNIVPANQALADFQGNSTADIQKQLLTQQVQGQLANANKYDPQFIAQALQQQQQANPQGVQARSDLYNQLEQQLNSNPNSPVANEMQRQVGEQVSAGSGLTPEEQAMLNKEVSQTGGLTGTTGTPDFERALTTGFAGEQRALNNSATGGQWLASGNTPADIEFRKQQQDLSNLSSFISGKTPQSQFAQLSGAQAGPTPNVSGTPLPESNLNAATQGAQAGLTQYG
jgi:hypothetical protein